MAYNVCVNCGTNLNHLLTHWTYELELYKQNLKDSINKETNVNNDESIIKEYEKYYPNLFFLKYNVDRLCCKTFFLSFIDYIPSTM